jgi:hypothetical protein
MNDMAKGLFFSEILTIYLEAFIDLAIVVTLNLMNPITDTFMDIASLVVAYVLLVSSQIVLPMLLIWII